MSTAPRTNPLAARIFGPSKRAFEEWLRFRADRDPKTGPGVVLITGPAGSGRKAIARAIAADLDPRLGDILTHEPTGGGRVVDPDHHHRAFEQAAAKYAGTLGWLRANKWAAAIAAVASSFALGGVASTVGAVAALAGLGLLVGEAVAGDRPPTPVLLALDWNRSPGGHARLSEWLARRVTNRDAWLIATMDAPLGQASSLDRQLEAGGVGAADLVVHLTPGGTRPLRQRSRAGTWDPTRCRTNSWSRCGKPPGLRVTASNVGTPPASALCSTAGNWVDASRRTRARGGFCGFQGFAAGCAARVSRGPSGINSSSRCCADSAWGKRPPPTPTPTSSASSRWLPGVELGRQELNRESRPCSTIGGPLQSRSRRSRPSSAMRLWAARWSISAARLTPGRRPGASPTATSNGATPSYAKPSRAGAWRPRGCLTNDR